MMNLIELLKKSIAALLLVFLASVMLTACSSDEEEAPPPPAEEETGVGLPDEEDNLCDELDGEERQQCLDELENEI
jgi:hypothetical protein